MFNSPEKQVPADDAAPVPVIITLPPPAAFDIEQSAVKREDGNLLVGCESDTKVTCCSFVAGKGFRILMWFMIVQAAALNIMGIVSVIQALYSSSDVGIQNNFLDLADDLTGLNTT